MRLPWKKQETELEREVRYHLESLADAFEREGLSREEAMLRARKEFGGVEQIKEECRDERRWRPLAYLGQDVVFGLRMLRRAPAVTAAAILSLALGIGATTAIMSLVDAVLWRQLAVPEPGQLTEILWQSKLHPDGLFQSSSGNMFPEGGVDVADFFSRAAFDAFNKGSDGRFQVAAHLGQGDVSTSYGGVTAVATLRPVSGNFFAMLGVQPITGRLLLPADDSPASPLAVVVSHSFWRRNLQNNPAAIGRTLRINNRAYTVAGVLPARFSGITVGDSTDLYTTVEHAPWVLEPDSWERKAASDPRSWYMQLLGRRAPGVTNEMVRPTLDALFRATWAAPPRNPQSAPAIRLQNAGSGLGNLRREVGSPLMLLAGLVGFVLLIACANIANLLLARADVRRREVGLRVALGCSRARLVRQFFTESALLAAFGGLVSLAVAYVTANFAVTLMPGNLRLDFALDARLIATTLAITALTTVMFGLYPAWRAAQMDAAPALKEGSGSVGEARRGRFTVGKTLVLAQVVLGVLLVAAAGVFTAHLRKIVSQDPGFERTRLLMFDLRPGESGYKAGRLRQFYTELEQRLRDVSGVASVGLARIRPMRGGGQFDRARISGHGTGLSTAVNFVTAGYLDTLGVPIIAGRGITQRDIDGAARVVTVSEDFIKDIGRSPVGLTMEMEDKQFEIVGVAARARYAHLTQPSRVVYLPHSLDQDTITAVLRTNGKPMQVVDSVRHAVAGMDENLPIVNLLTMEEQIAATLRRERLFAWLCGAFGVLALVLCMVGLYGVMSYATSRRTTEIGIRMALGASPRDVLRHTVGEGMAVALSGCALGAPLVWWAAQKFVDYKRFGMEPLDISILLWASAALAGAALLAVLGPAIRAASADPMKALREG